MSKNWDYAELTKAASEAGGPAKLADNLIETGRQLERPNALTEGRIEGTLATIFAGAAICGIYKLINLAKETYKANKEAKQKKMMDEAEAQKDLFIQSFEDESLGDPDEINDFSDDSEEHDEDDEEVDEINEDSSDLE